jgi:hypothetical protein
MSDPIRFELAGKNTKQWNRISKNLVKVIMDGMTAVMPPGNEDVLKSTEQSLSDAAEISKGWLKAKIDKPSIDNEKVIAETYNLFEDLKTKQTKRIGEEIANEKGRIANESARLDLAIKRVKTAIVLLGLMQKHFVLRDGELTLVLTNEDLAVFVAGMKELSGPA